MDNCFNTSISYATIGCTVICLFSELAFHHSRCSHCLQLLAEHEHAVGLRLLHGLQKTYRASCRHLHMTRSLPHRVHLTYGEFLLVSLSVAPEILWWWTRKEWQGRLPSCTSSNAQKWGAWPHAMQWVQCCHQLCLKEFKFSGTNVFRMSNPSPLYHLLEKGWRWFHSWFIHCVLNTSLSKVEWGVQPQS